MGFMCSWIAVEGVSREDLLDFVQMEATDTETLPCTGEYLFSFHAFANGWSVLFSEDFAWASRDRVREVSRLGLAVGCQYEDRVEMASTICAARDGVELWRIHHINDPV